MRGTNNHYRVFRDNGQPYRIEGEHYLSQSSLIKEIAETLVFLQDGFNATYDIHLGKMELLLLSDEMKKIRESKNGVTNDTIHILKREP